MTHPDAVRRLKPCPFCGHDEIKYFGMNVPGDDFNHTLECQSCAVKLTRVGNNVDDAIADLFSAWNTRAPAPRAVVLPQERSGDEGDIPTWLDREEVPVWVSGYNKCREYCLAAIKAAGCEIAGDEKP